MKMSDTNIIKNLIHRRYNVEAGVDLFDNKDLAMRAVHQTAMSRHADGTLLFPDFTFGDAVDMVEELS